MKLSNIKRLEGILSKELKAGAGANSRKPYNPSEVDKNAYKEDTSRDKTKYQTYTKHDSPNKVGP